MKYQLIVDYWEGQGDIDEITLRRECVIGFIARLNDMNGGHHLDKNFEKNWMEAGSLGRALYFVYNPWCTGLQNFDWYMTYAPKKAATMVDLEVRRAGYSQFTYGKEVEIFLSMLRREKLNYRLYSGGGYTDILWPWPYEEYWWARYIKPFWYPDTRTAHTWEEVRNEADITAWNPYGTFRSYGPCTLWQITGDRLVMPGCGPGAVDISLYNGSASAWLDWCGRPVYQLFMPWIHN